MLGSSSGSTWADKTHACSLRASVLSSLPWGWWGSWMQDAWVAERLWAGIGSAGADPFSPLPWPQSPPVHAPSPTDAEFYSFLCTFQPLSHMTLVPRGEGSQGRSFLLVKGQESPQRSSTCPRTPGGTLEPGLAPLPGNCKLSPPRVTQKTRPGLWLGRSQQESWLAPLLSKKKRGNSPCLGRHPS